MSTPNPSTTEWVPMWNLSGATVPLTSPELDYAQITADSAAITATTEATAGTVITGNPVTYDGTTRVKVEFFCSYFTGPASNMVTFVLMRDGVGIGQARASQRATNVVEQPFFMEVFDTPSAGAHTYSVRLFVSGSNTTVKAGPGGAGAFAPAFLRVTKDPPIGPQGPVGPQGGNGFIDVQTFPTNGTWTKPANATVAMVMVWGGGGGGGGGSRANSAAQRGGGCGAGGGAHRRVMLKASALPATVPVTVAVGGTGGPGAAATSTDGQSGNVGGNTSFGSLVIGYGGGPGLGGLRLSGNPSGGGGGGSGQVGLIGSTANTTPGGIFGGGSGGNFGQTGYIMAGDAAGGGGGGGGSSAGNNVTTPGGYAVLGGGGGGGGGHSYTDNAVYPAAAGGLSGSGYTATFGEGGAAGVTSPTAPTPGSNGADMAADWSNGGSGGGGGGGCSGASNLAGANGGNGGLGGGGGGGGGSGTGTVTPGSNGGNGGNGGNGYCVVICW